MSHRLTTTSPIALCAAFSLALAVPAAPAFADDHAATEAAEANGLEELVSQVSIPYEEFQLENGLTVIVHEDRKAPIVGLAVWYNVGSKDEPEGKTGFAHLFEHLMFNGSENAPNDYFQYLQEMGATDYNGTTNFDRTNYFQTVPRPALERALWLESDRMGYLLGAVTQEKLDNQRRVVQNEKRQGDNQPGGLVFYEILDNMFPEGHPYGHSVIGSMADLDSASMEDVQNWFRDKYGPNNATVVLAGDVSAAEARPLMEKYFGEIGRGPVNNPAEAEIPTLSEDKRSVMKDKVAATSLTKYWPAPGITSDELTALNIGMSIFGGLASSRLDEVLVRDEQLAVGVSAGNFDFQRVGIMLVNATLRPGVELETMEARLDELIAEYIEEGPTEDEVRRAATSQLAGTIRGLEQVGGFGGKAVTLARGEVLADNPAQYAKNFNTLATLTPADVKAAMQRWLTRPSFTMVLEPGERDGSYEEAASVATEGENASERDRGAEEITVSKVRPAPPIDSVAALDFPDVERATLANGMKVTYAKRDAVPATYVTLSFDAGGAADPDGKEGLSGLTMGLFDEGTAEMTSQEIAEERERLGVSISSSNSDDRSSFTLSALSANLTPSLDLMSKIVREPAFAETDLERVRTQTITGIKQQMNSPQGVAFRAIGPEIFGDSPYGGVATVESVGSIARADLVSFKDAWVRPDNGEFFVISDRPLAEIVDSLNGVFGDWTPPAAAKGAKAFGEFAENEGNRIILINRPNSPQSFILGSQLTNLDASDPAYVDFTNANNSLGGNFLARLNMNLRETKGWSYGVRGGPQARENAVVYSISGGVQADQTGPSVAEMIRETSEFLSTNGVTEEELTRNVAAEIGELPGRFETSGAVLNAIRNNARYNRPDNYYETLVERYSSQTRESLDAAAREAISADEFVWIVVGDASVVKEQLDALGLPVEVRELPSSE
ncbi:MAG: pitrilysin family protein [Pseudomonadota bacterium]